eukprot:287386_1
MSSSDNKSNRKILILDKDPLNSKYHCPLTTCPFQTETVSAILSHMWKFKETSKRATNTKSICTGQTSPSLTLYPKLFYHSVFYKHVYHTLSDEYPSIAWNTIQQHIHPPDHSPPQVITLIQQFDMFMTTDYLVQHHPIKLPKSLQPFLLNTGFNPRQLPSLLRRIKQESQVHEPPHKKRKLSPNTTTDTQHETGLTLPSLNLLNMTANTSKSEDECMIPYDTLPADTPPIPSKKRKRRGIGPRCGACHTELNPCDVMIQCTECEYDETEVILCPFCFKTGSEFASHKRFHRYNVLRPIPDFKLQSNETHSRWCGNDEWNLLHGLRRYGLGGNWSQISKMINSKSESKDYRCKYIEQHFYNKYGDTVFMKTNDADAPQQQQLPKQKKQQKTQKENRFTDKHKRKCGYRELRDEFEAEWNNNAEAMIGDMYFSPYDTKQERALKLEGIRIYNAVLGERETRKKFIKHYGVICKDRHIYKRNMEQEEIELEAQISDNLAVFARYTQDKQHNFTEFRALTQGLIEEHLLRKKIDKLKHYLLNGVTSVSQMQIIEKYVEKQQELKEGEEVDVDGCSLDAISTYLKLMQNDSNNNAHHKKKKRERYTYYAANKVVSDKDWNINKMKKVEVLNEGEKKLCNVLKIAPSDYEYIQQQISKRVYLHGLANKEKMPQQLYIDIDDVKKVKQSMTMRIGLVDPCVLTKEVRIPQNNTN